MTEGVHYAWPNDAAAAVCLTFDVDAETGTFSSGPESYRRLSTLSEFRYSVVRGVWRILEILRRQEVSATFFVPGWTARNYPHVVEAILEGGHEVAHHGDLHALSHLVTTEVQQREIYDGLQALESVGVPRPTGYRSTSWEVTPETLTMVRDAGFVYDSSFMSDDRPYVERHGELEILEIPSHWSLDDWPYFGYTLDYGGNMNATDVWSTNLWNEYRAAAHERRSVVYTCHPEVIGRAYRAYTMEELIERIRDDGRGWFARMDEVAGVVSPLLSGPLTNR